MRRRRGSWQGGIGAAVVIGGLLLGGSGVASAASPTSEEILAKINEVLSTVGNIREGNHTLRWDQNLPAAQRFEILAAFNNEAVLDKETGLVWQKSPVGELYNWTGARGRCTQQSTGGRKSWRLPSVHELASLVDPSVPSPGLSLPPGHPFLNVQPALYWSASSAGADLPNNAWIVSFANGSTLGSLKGNDGYVWCVRGGHNGGGEY